MIKNFVLEITSALIIVILSFVLINPADLFMTTVIEMALLVGLVIIFGLFASFVWKEKIQDERDSLLRMMADRIGFLAGSTVLIIGIIVESLNHELSDWLLVALSAMIIAKIGGIIYGKLNH